MAIINRERAEALIEEQVVSNIFQDAPKESVFLQLARRMPNMTSNQTRIKVLDVLPMAYWVNGDTGIKQTSEQAWDNVHISAGELAVIVPIPEAVLDDASFDILGEVQPRVMESIGQKVDAAVFFGANKPAEWRSDIITTARQAGNNVADGTDLYEKLLGVGGVFDKVENGGYMANGCVSALNMRAKLRSLRDDNGAPLFTQNMQEGARYALDGSPMYFPRNGFFDKSIAQMVVGDFSQAVYAIRQDVTVKILDQATIIDPVSKTVVYSLAQQDMIALRVVFRMGWALPNPATRLDEDRVTCPFAYLEPATAVTTQTATFTVADSSGNIAGAIVDVNGARLKTNASGQAVFNLRAGSYAYKVKKDGYKAVSGTITVASEAATQSVTLVAN